MNPIDVKRRIDLAELLNGKFKKEIPGWVIRLLGKILCIPQLNHFMDLTPGDGWNFSENLTRTMNLNLEVKGLENVPADGTLYTFVSNHPLGGADGVMLSSIIGKNFGDLWVPVTDFLMAIKPLRKIWIPVNKVGSQARTLSSKLDEGFKSDRQMLVFPAGLCSRRKKGVLKDLPWKKTFITKSVQTGRAIVPIHFIGENSSFYYTVTNMFDGMKFNPSMIFLPREFVNSAGKTFKVIFGKPIPAETFDSSRSALEWAQLVREKVYELE